MTSIERLLHNLGSLVVGITEHIRGDKMRSMSGKAMNGEGCAGMASDRGYWATKTIISIFVLSCLTPYL